MADITMCHGNKCSLKETCKRFTSIPSSSYQSCFIKEPFEIKEGVVYCECYWEEDNLSKK